MRARHWWGMLAAATAVALVVGGGWVAVGSLSAGRSAGDPAGASDASDARVSTASASSTTPVCGFAGTLVDKITANRPAGTNPPALDSWKISGDGTLLVEDAQGRRQVCDWLAGPATVGTPLAPDDTVLVQPLGGDARAVVLGRIGAYTAAPEHVTIRAAETLTLQCGDSQVDLRADGKLMIRGDDVLVRAKGTQRIRAGTVAIN